MLCNFFLFTLLIALLKLIKNRLKALHEAKHGKHVKVLTFIHPNCYDFGGGEKVLWMIMHALSSLKKQNLNHFYKINILTAPKNTIYKKMQNQKTQAGAQADEHLLNNKLTYSEDLLAKLKERFSINLSKRSEAVKQIEMIEFKSAKYLSPFPFCTMLLQIVFQMIFAFEVCSRVFSDAIIDTTGLPFAYSILGFIGNHSNLGAYVHYPFISEEMIANVKSGKDGVHSQPFIAKFRFYKKIKLPYYSLILKLYEFNCKFLKFIFSNSTWTSSHMHSIVPEIPNEILYPPCSIGFYRNNNIQYNNIHNNKNLINENFMRKENVIVSFAQFRPEKNHKMQIDILRKVREQLPNYDVKLWLIGGVRNEDDKSLYNGLKNYVNHMGLNEHVEFLPNMPSSEVKLRFQVAKVGIHTMKDEHFGISVIEMISAGLITIAHNSAGPKKDIIGSSPVQVGLLCEGKNTIFVFIFISFVYCLDSIKLLLFFCFSFFIYDL